MIADAEIISRSGSRRTLSLVFLLLATALLLGLGLGQRALTGSEDRWAEIARNMLLYKDWFHPIINGEIYFDKPLLSYWPIVISATITQSLNEFSVRLPGVAAGLLTLFCSYRIAAQWFDRNVAWLSVWLMATCFGFLFWTHTASAEMWNVALITAAVAWFIYRRERTDFLSYLIFYLLCAVGSQMKGLTAWVLPVLIVAPFLLREKRWRRHLNLSHLAALLLSIGIFALPYLRAELHALPQGVLAQRNQLTGLDLLIRENLVRFIEPFDHVDPFYSYLYQVPRIVFPWSFLFIAALCYYVPRYSGLSRHHRWLLEAIGLIFVFFTASGSRRWYYILPIMPFCMMLVAAYIAEAPDHRWRRPAMLATSATLSVVTVLLILLPIATHVGIRDMPVPVEFWLSSAATLLGTALIFHFNRTRPANLMLLARLDEVSARSLSPALLMLSALLMTVTFGLVLPGTDRYRQEKPFALSLAGALRAGERIVFFKTPHTTTVFYLNQTKAIPVIDNRTEIPTDASSLIVVVEQKDKDALFREFPKLRNAVPLIAVKEYKEKFLSEKSALTAYRLSRADISG